MKSSVLTNVPLSYYNYKNRLRFRCWLLHSVGDDEEVHSSVNIR